MLPTLLQSIKNQTLQFNKIFLFLAEKDKIQYNLNISEFNIITIKEDLRPNNKYYYVMQLFRDYAIITIDDDTYLATDTFESLFNSYLEYPNVISGRRIHLMNYTINGEVSNYSHWRREYTKIKKPDFNLFGTGVGSMIYPPDILNINENYLDLIKEAITTDDIILKYFSVIKGIPIKWTQCNKINGLIGLIPYIKGENLLESINKINLYRKI